MSDNFTKALKTPPHSDEAEVSVLGGILMDREAVIDVAEFLQPEHFYSSRHHAIYEAILSLYESREPIDIVTVTERLKERKRLTDAGGAAYVTSLVDKVPTSAHVAQYGKIIKNHSTKRRLMQVGSKLFDMASDEGREVSELLDEAETEVFSITQNTLSTSFKHIKKTLADAFDRLDELSKQDGGLRGVPTGFADLDDKLAGLQKGNLIILAARPGVGKTTLAINIAQHMAVKHKRSVGVFSLEMSSEELADRMLVGQADIDAWKLKTGRLNDDEFTRLSIAMGELAEAPVYIDDTPGMSILEMRTKARRLQVEHGVELIIVDYLQLAKSRNLENRVQEVSEISQGLKNMARELKVPVLALSQLSRLVEQRGTKRPQLSDLRESGSIEQDADVVMFLWREDDDKLENVNLDIAKHRNGSVGQIQLFFKGDRVRYYGMESRR
jgi:replicative DNA helicase